MQGAVSLICLMDSSLVRADHLVKRYGQFEAVSGISFSIEKGETFGFLGPNGAGKTSTMKMVSGVAAPSAGSLSIFGMDPQRDGASVRSRLGVVTQEDSLESELTVLDLLALRDVLPYSEGTHDVAAHVSSRGGVEQHLHATLVLCIKRELEVGRLAPLQSVIEHLLHTHLVLFRDEVL